MRNRTVYTVAVAGESVLTRTEKAAAIAQADQLAADHRDKDVTVTTQAGTVVHEVPAEAGAPVEAARPHFAPWTRVDSADFIEGMQVPAGYVVAYVRKRINAAAARHEAREGWVILQLEADGTTSRYDAVNTKQGQEIFNELRTKQLAARAAAAPAEEVTASE